MIENKFGNPSVDTRLASCLSWTLLSAAFASTCLAVNKLDSPPTIDADSCHAHRPIEPSSIAHQGQQAGACQGVIGYRCEGPPGLVKAAASHCTPCMWLYFFFFFLRACVWFRHLAADYGSSLFTLAL